MLKTHSLKRFLGLMAGTGSAVAAGGDEPSDFQLWLFSLPNEVLAGFVILASALVALAVWVLFARRAAAAGRKLWSGLSAYSVAAVGAVAGLGLALGLSGPWQAYVMTTLTGMPPTAAGVGPDGTPPGPPDIALLGEPDDEGRSLPPQVAKKVVDGRARHATVNFGALGSEVIDLNLFNNETVTARRDRIVQDTQGASVWVGHIEGIEGSEVILVMKGQALMGTLNFDGRAFEIVYVKGRTHALREVDPKRTPPKFEPDELEHPAEADLAGGTGTTPTSGTTSTGQVIDIMVVYTPQARTNAGGVSGIETRIINAVTQANQAYINSKIPMQVNLVKMAETNYAESGVMSTDKSRLQATSDGYMDEIHALRDQVGADQVVLVNANKDVCGVASVMTTVSTNFASAAFAAVHDDSYYNCLGSNQTLAHEMGHNQGNMHDQTNSTYQGAYPDSYGYRVCGQFRDIMSYVCTGGNEPRISYFSSSDPTLTYLGQPIGVAGSADTAHSMALTAPTVASFRASVTVAPAAATGLAATVSGSNAVVLSWTDVATNENGYKVERSVDGVNWSEVAALNVNTVGFTDSGLGAGQTYAYRVYAWNSAGNSPYSNTAQATLPGADTTAPLATLAPVSGTNLSQGKMGTTSVVAKGSDNVAINTMSLSIDGTVVSTLSQPGATGTITYSWNLKKARVGNHTLSTTVTDSSGLSTSITNSVTVTK